LGHEILDFRYNETVVLREPSQFLVTGPVIFTFFALGDKVGTESSNSCHEVAIDLLANSWKEFRYRDFVNRAARDRNRKGWQALASFVARECCSILATKEESNFPLRETRSPTMHPEVIVEMVRHQRMTIKLFESGSDQSPLAVYFPLRAFQGERICRR
jgi:hypothetical protein